MAAKDNEIQIKRVYDAPLKAVWDAWTDEKQTEQWWGPRGWWIKSHSKDLRPGGKWKYDMFGPNGEKFENVTLYHVVEPLARLEYDHGGGEDRPPLFRVTVTFKDVKGKTEMVMTMALASAQAATETKKMIKKTGGNSTWDRLAEYLQPEHESFVINRSFQAPIEKVWEAWTNPDVLAKWMGPAGSTMQWMKQDFRVGGRSIYRMDFMGMTMRGSLTYHEILPVTRLVYDQDFRDENDAISRHPGMPVWPEFMTTTLILADEGDGSTRVTLSWVPSAKATKDELQAFVQEKRGMLGGWTGSFDKLEEILA